MTFSLVSVPAIAANISSVYSGAWSDPATWDVGVPGSLDDVTVQAGDTVTCDVDSAQVLSLTIEEDAVLLSASGTSGVAGAPGGDAADIVVLAQNDITILGTIRTGDGGNGGASADSASAGQDGTANGGDGGDGGDLKLVSTAGDVILTDHGRIVLGDGGAGGAAVAVGGPGSTGSAGGDAEAHGGVGGLGGSMTLSCVQGDFTVSVVSGIISGSNGGSGGSSTAIGGNGGSASGGGLPGVGGSTVGGGGHGGPTGDLAIICNTVNDSTSLSDPAQFFLSILSGGNAGQPGIDSTATGDNGTPSLARLLPLGGECWNTAGAQGASDSRGPTHGADGWMFPTDGADQSAAGKTGVGTGKGGNAMAYGGNGGSFKLLGLELFGANVGVTLCPDWERPGHGGDATSSGGPGGPVGGSGGDAFSQAGHAGDVPGIVPAARCGKGGDAEAGGGGGRTGTTCCTPPEQGQSGGNGGSATAYGGNSSNFSLPPWCRGGNATTKPGNGGNGGDGEPPGLQGVQGSRARAAGTGSPNGSIIDLPAKDGDPGGGCPKPPGERRTPPEDEHGRLRIITPAPCCFASDACDRSANFALAQAGTMWIGWSPTGSGPYELGAPGMWDFDDRGTVSCPVEDDYQEYIKNGAYAQYWMSEDVLAQKGLFWHAEDYTGVELACSTNPITGDYSAWCGKYAPDPGECFSSAPGYGRNWNQWLCKPVTLDAATPSLAYHYNGNLAPGFDYTYVIIDPEYPDSCGWVGDNSDTLRCYDSVTGGSESIDLTTWDDGNDCDDVAFDADYSGDSVKVCFIVVSDGGWDDEDGGYDTCDGAFNVDDIVIDTAPSSGGMITTTFETGTLEGWDTCGGSSAGDYCAIRDVSSFINNDVCGFDNCDMDGCVLAFYDPGIPGQYGNGGHYGDGTFFKRAWTPPIDMTSYPTRGYVLSYDIYVDLPIENGVFYRNFVSYMQCADCPMGAWSPAVSDNYAYYAQTPRCGQRTWGFSHLVPTDADSVKIGLVAWNGCQVWNVQCTNGNESPIFDNIKIGIWDLSAPLGSIREVDNFTDAFPEDDAMVATNTALIDAANNKSQQGYFLRLADSAVVRLAAPNAQVEMCFRIIPGPGTNLTDPFFTTKYPDAGGWNDCEMSDDVLCTRMDTAFAAGDGDTNSVYEFQVVFPGYYATMIHEADPNYTAEGEEIMPDSLFTPGTQIYYGFKTKYVGGVSEAWLPSGVDLVNDPVGTAFEVSVLPDFCKDPLTCLLYVDYFNRCAQTKIENALTLLGRTWDRFDLRAESSHQGNGIGNRVLGPGRYRLARGPIGPSLAHLSQYTAMLLNTGDLEPGTVISDGGTGTPDDPTNDITFMDNWIEEGRTKGLWLSGNSLAADFESETVGPKPTFLANELATDMIHTSYQAWSGHPKNDDCRVLKARDGEMKIQNIYSVQDSLRIYGSGCPANYNYDVLLDRATGRGYANVALMYDLSGGYASVDHIFTAEKAPYDTVRTKVDGFGMNYLRNLSPPCNNVDNVGIAMWMRDVLGGNNNDGYFYDHKLNVQYCPPQGAEDPLVDVPRGGRTYANALFQNYPNPFRGGAVTTIHYSVAKAGQVEIRVFDVAGRLVSSIVDEAELGDNYVVWNGRSKDDRRMASGVYFYQIKAGEFTSHKKMLMVN